MNAFGATDANGKAVQFNRAVLEEMTDEERVEARRAGHFDDLLDDLLAGRSSEPEPEPREGQLSRSDLGGMAPEAVNAALRDGKLDDLLGVGSPADTDPEPDPPPPNPDPADLGARGGLPNMGQLSRADLQSMRPEQISAALREGRLADLLSGGR